MRPCLAQGEVAQVDAVRGRRSVPFRRGMVLDPKFGDRDARVLEHVEPRKGAVAELRRQGLDLNPLLGIKSGIPCTRVLCFRVAAPGLRMLAIARRDEG